jgi:hypothetical protein
MTLTPQQRRAIEERLTEAQAQRIADIWRGYADGAIDGEEAQARAAAHLERLYRAAFPVDAKPKSARLAPSRYYARVNEALYADRDMTPSARRLVLQLVQLARGRKRVEAFIEQLAETLDLSTRSIQRAQRRAEERGFIAVEHVRQGSINDPNIYHLLDLAVAPAPKKARRHSRVAGEKRVYKSSRDSARDRARDSAMLAMDDSFLNHSHDSRVWADATRGSPGDKNVTPQGRYKSPSEISISPIPLTPFPSADDERCGAPLVAARGHSPAPSADSGASSEAACCQAERAANFGPSSETAVCAASPPEPP